MVPSGYQAVGPLGVDAGGELAVAAERGLVVSTSSSRATAGSGVWGRGQELDMDMDMDMDIVEDVLGWRPQAEQTDSPAQGGEAA
ncbi:hypothetical protein KV205_26655 [Streptomyces sp. SKN60]|uniref:hypothetical protein n=1 Tax=Streptomyces sp. SKN60 TaxID=2855506 RepID=UPI002245DE7D|nr:hypothetical protein [Streptomyces sp. SKN60]MCX2184084.1 hypothetical protein [Streptomyces sp. SKN60]